MLGISPALRPWAFLALLVWGCSGTGGGGGGAETGGSSGTAGSNGSAGGARATGGRTGSAGALGGTAGSLGTAGAAGATAAGGRIGGGTGGRGGTTGAGGAGTGGAATGSGGSGSTATCTFSPTASTSTRIPTVGILTWSTTLAGVSAAHVDFGLTTSYGMTAPVNLALPSYRTLLLGMKAARLYHYRITASGPSGTCVSPDYTIMTGALANGLQRPTLTTTTASAVFGGFLITGQYTMNAGAAGAPAYILDADGDYVWWFNINGDVTGARLSYDATHMWINSANVPSGMARVHRVTLDGMTDEDLSSQFTGLNHQLTVLPDETVAYYAYGANGCDDIKERSPAGTVKTIANARTAHGGTGACHVNTVQYSAADDTLIFSDLDNQDLTKVTRAGVTVWVLNGTGNVFTGASWRGGQHGLHILGVDHLLLFNNNSRIVAGGTMSIGGTGDGSSAIEVMLDVTAKTATQLWAYKASPAVQNDVMGDVQRLPNGNTIVGFSTKGTLHEITAAGAVVQRWSWPAGASFGYIEKRATLYGPPPR